MHVFSKRKNTFTNCIVSKSWKAWSLYPQQYPWYVANNWMSFEEAKWAKIKLIFKFSWVLYKCMQLQQITTFLKQTGNQSQIVIKWKGFVLYDRLPKSLLLNFLAYPSFSCAFHTPMGCPRLKNFANYNFSLCQREWNCVIELHGLALYIF